MPLQKIDKQIVGKVNGQDIFLFRISNGLVNVGILNFGGIIKFIDTPDRSGNCKNIVAGFEKFESYLNDHPYFGCIVGRYANRIANGRFSINGTDHQLSVNEGGNHLHGGFIGFDKKVWAFEGEINSAEGMGLKLSCESEDGEEGYPGKLNTSVSYILTDNNELIIRCHAKTSKATPINLTNHTYFNLSGFQEPTVRDHELIINSDAFVVKDYNGLPTGKIASVNDSPLDFRKFKRIGAGIDSLTEDNGYNHCLVLSRTGKNTDLAAELYDPFSGRVVRLMTDQPGLQIYTSNEWNGSLTGVQGKSYIEHGAIALEAQNFPDAPNHPDFPNSILWPDEMYQSTIIFQFLTR